MATIGQIRGALLEEAVLYLLQKVGYKIVRTPRDSIDSSDLKNGGSGLELQGRGTWHQIDAIAEQHHTPAFTYPLRLLVEAKFYTTQSVGINVIRNSVGVHKDVSENYFSKHRKSSINSSIRFNYQSALFSVSGYTQRAIDYAIAHQMFLIQYKNIPAIDPVIQAIRNIEETSLTKRGIESISEVRDIFRKLLTGRNIIKANGELLTEEGIEIIRDALVGSLLKIGGSYFGMLQGRWPLHLLTIDPLPISAFGKDIVKCKLNGNREGEWYFSPTSQEQNSNFKLQFNLPPELAELISRHWGNPIGVAETKSRNFSYIALSGNIGGVWRNVKIELDRSWLSDYINQNRI